MLGTGISAQAPREEQMRRIALIAAAALALAGCSHSDGIGMDENANPDISEGATMQSLTVSWFGDAASEHAEADVTIDAARGISVSAAQVGADGSVVDSCTGSAELSEEDDAGLVAAIAEADLVGMEEPFIACEEVEPTSGFELTLEYLFGEETITRIFSSTDDCPIVAIEPVADLVAELSESNVADCNTATFAAGNDDVEDDDGAPADTDGDCILDDIEAKAGTDPNDADTDDDGLPDGWDSAAGAGEDMNCNGQIDVDANGMPAETDPLAADSDGDGQSDADEMACGGTFDVANVAMALDPNLQCTPVLE
jgi:predicted small secreted protein